MTEWNREDPRYTLHSTKRAAILVQCSTAFAVARVTTKGACNPWHVEFVSRPVYESVQFDDLDANDNWPDGWLWVPIPSAP